MAIVRRVSAGGFARVSSAFRTSTIVIGALQVRGFHAPRISFTVGILRALPEDKYLGALRLLDAVRRHLSSNLRITSSVPLILPWSRSLAAIDFDSLVASERGMQEIFHRCVKIEGMSGPKVDLSLAPWIFRNIVATPSQP